MQDFREEVFCAVRFRSSKNASFGESSTILPSSIKSPDSPLYGQNPFRGSPPSWSSFVCQFHHHVQHFVDHLRIRADVGSSNSMAIGSIHNARASPHAAADRRKAAPEIYWHVRKSHALQQFQCFFTSGRFIALSTFTCARVRFSIIDKWGNNQNAGTPSRRGNAALPDRFSCINHDTIDGDFTLLHWFEAVAVLISVDLPEPDGPQTTTTSLFSLRLSSRSAPESDHTILNIFQGNHYAVLLFK